MTQFVNHCGAEVVTRAQVESIPVPPRTHTHNPVPYAQAIHFADYAMREQNPGLELVKEQYSLNRQGQQLFAVMTYGTDRDDSGLSIGLRQSYDKSLALGTVVGTQVFVCDNLCFRGSDYRVVRKNTLNVWHNYTGMMRKLAGGALESYDTTQAENDRMGTVPVSLDRGYELLGRMLGERILTQTQARTAFQDWHTPRHEEFSDRNLWGWYNSVTEGLKHGAQSRRMGRQIQSHLWLTTQTPEGMAVV